MVYETNEVVNWMSKFVLDYSNELIFYQDPLVGDKMPLNILT